MRISMSISDIMDEKIGLELNRLRKLYPNDYLFWEKLARKRDFNRIPAQIETYEGYVFPREVFEKRYRRI